VEGYSLQTQGLKQRRKQLKQKRENKDTAPGWANLFARMQSTSTAAAVRLCMPFDFALVLFSTDGDLDCLTDKLTINQIPPGSL
jgi:hypothetical protein